MIVRTFEIPSAALAEHFFLTRVRESAGDDLPEWKPMWPWAWLKRKEPSP